MIHLARTLLRYIGRVGSTWLFPGTSLWAGVMLGVLSAHWPIRVSSPLGHVMVALLFLLPGCLHRPVIPALMSLLEEMWVVMWVVSRLAVLAEVCPRVILEALLPRVILEALLPRVILEALLPRVILEALLPRVILEALLPRVILEALLPRVILEALLPRVILEALLPRVILEALLPRVILEVLLR